MPLIDSMVLPIARVLFVGGDLALPLTSTGRSTFVVPHLHGNGFGLGRLELVLRLVFIV